MKELSRRIEEVYRRKVSLLSELLRCLHLEKESLIDVNVKTLWSLMEEKESLLRSIGKTDEEIHALQREGAEGQDAPKEVCPLATTFLQEIRGLKLEIGERVKENVSFIQETLHFFDEMVSLFAAGNRDDRSYDLSLKRPRFSQSLIYEKEV